MHRFLSPRALALALPLALCLPACDFGRDDDTDAGRFSSIDAPTPPGTDAPLPPDLDAPGLDGFGPATDDTGGGIDDDAGTQDDAPGLDVGSAPIDAGSDAPRVSMPCMAAGACDPFDASACGAGMACRGGAMGGPTACAPTAAMVRAAGETCTASNQCVGGTACLDFGDGLRCHALCPMGSIGACGPDAACNGTITGGDACIQVCRALPERCDIYAQDCADPLDACTFASNPETDERYTGCRTAGTRTDGQPCGGGAGSCARGLVCITSGGTSSCHHACDPAASPTTCPAMQACTGLARSWGVGFCEGSM